MNGKFSIVLLTALFALPMSCVFAAPPPPTDQEIRAAHQTFIDDLHYNMTHTAGYGIKFCDFYNYFTYGNYKIIKSDIDDNEANLKLEPHFVATESFDDLLKKEGCNLGPIFYNGYVKMYGKFKKGDEIPTANDSLLNIAYVSFRRVGNKWKPQ